LAKNQIIVTVSAEYEIETMFYSAISAYTRRINHKAKTTKGSLRFKTVTPAKGVSLLPAPAFWDNSK